MLLRKPKAAGEDPAAAMLAEEVQHLLEVIAELRKQPSAPYTVAELDRLEGELHRITALGMRVAG